VHEARNLETIFRYLASYATSKYQGRGQVILRLALISICPKIYGHLLDGKRNQVKRAHSHSHADRVFYKFHTSILAVNRKIHNEAEEYLYKHNEFVVVNHDPTQSPDTFMPPWTPLVAELGAGPMRHHSLEITFLLHHRATHSKTAAEAWLLLAQDVDIYCLVINLYMSRDIPQTPMLALHPNGSFHDYHADEDDRPLRPHYLRLDFGNNCFREATAESKSGVISRFCSMSSSSLHVDIRGHVIQTPELTNLQTAARPGLMCTSSLVSRTFRNLENLKGLADSSVHDNELELADVIYLLIWNIIRRGFPLQPPFDMRHPMQQLLIDTALTVAHLHLKNKDIPSFATEILRTAYLRGSGKALFPDLVMSHVFHIILLSTVTSEASSTVAPGASSTPLLDVTIAECIARLRLPGSSDHQLHDAAILQRCPDHNKKSECKDLPLESCSAYALPPNCVNTRKADGGVRTPANIDGWLDTEILRGTNKKTREEINRLEVARGWEVTRFEDYD
jgi:hypothetical protein